MPVYNTTMQKYDVTTLEWLLKLNCKCKQNFEMTDSCLFADEAFSPAASERSSSSSLLLLFASLGAFCSSCWRKFLKTLFYFEKKFQIQDVWQSSSGSIPCFVTKVTFGREALLVSKQLKFKIFLWDFFALGQLSTNIKCTENVFSCHFCCF